MSINEMDSKVKELRELRRMAEELAGEIEALQDTIKADMTASGTDEAQGVDWKITWKNVQSKRFDKAAMVSTFGQDCYDKFCKTVSSRRFVIA